MAESHPELRISLSDELLPGDPPRSDTDRRRMDVINWRVFNKDLTYAAGLQGTGTPMELEEG